MQYYLFSLRQAASLVDIYKKLYQQPRVILWGSQSISTVIQVNSFVPTLEALAPLQSHSAVMLLPPFTGGFNNVVYSPTGVMRYYEDGLVRNQAIQYTLRN